MSSDAIDVGMGEPSPPVYLGDGLYAEFDGFQVKLYASNGLHTTNVVYLEPSVLHAFFAWVTNLKGAVKP
jgi:hypothetical protein